MWGLAIIGVMLSSVSSLDLMGVSYSFDTDFERIFNNKTCTSIGRWVFTDDLDLKTTSASKNYHSGGIRSSRESCITSFPIVFFNDSVLELNVYLDVLRKESGIQVTVFDDSSEPKVTYSYNKRSRTFQPGWTTLTIAVNINSTGYVNLIGRSYDQEVVLIESFRYITRNARSSHSQNADMIDESLIENIREQSELIFDYEGSGEDGDFGSGEEDFDGFFEDELDNDINEKGTIIIET